MRPTPVGQGWQSIEYRSNLGKRYDFGGWWDSAGLCELAALWLTTCALDTCLPPGQAFGSSGVPQLFGPVSGAAAPVSNTEESRNGIVRRIVLSPINTVDGEVLGVSPRSNHHSLDMISGCEELLLLHNKCRTKP